MARWLAGLAVLLACCEARAQVEQGEWCAPEFTAVVEGICHYAPPGRSEAIGATLVIFLHGVVQPESGWQYAQQRAIARAARRHDFSVLMPRGRRGVGPKGMEDWWTWPTAVQHQQEVEEQILVEWGAARWLLEKAMGGHFSRVLLFGFSNGAYYASQLALRGAYPADGYALFAGGSGARWLGSRASTVRHRPPIFVGFGGKDRRAKSDGQKLNRLLKELGWPHLTREHPRGGHTMSDALMEQAARYLGLNPPGPAAPT